MMAQVFYWKKLHTDSPIIPTLFDVSTKWNSAWFSTPSQTCRKMMFPLCKIPPSFIFELASIPVPPCILTLNVGQHFQDSRIHGSFSVPDFFLSRFSLCVGITFLQSLFYVSLSHWWWWRTSGSWIIIITCGNGTLGTVGLFSLPLYCAFNCHPQGNKK